MNHRTQNHSSALKASQNLSYQTENTVVQMPIPGYNDAHLADTRVEIQMANAAVMLQMGPASEQIASIADLADRRVEIDRDHRLKLTLHEWEDSLKKALLGVQFRRTSCINVKNELYQLIGFYIVFQGVVLTAVAQASLLIKCHTSWGPASLSLLASIAAIPAVHDRLKEYNVHKNNLFWEIEESNLINEKITRLKRKGACFDFAEHEGVKEKIYAEEKKRQFRAQCRKSHTAKWWTTLFLCVFSSIILSYCYVLPCWEKH